MIKSNNDMIKSNNDDKHNIEKILSKIDILDNKE